ncbi:MAG TPA: glycosyl-4,4'-diaponeurosporenoate acyltransferase [Candidatus Faecousia faecigallinarum]|nr:glycosyl-4,4'-diaponeurosporenoate acyltransferase [Candidatus Faecousia faecigallinarum]
MTLLDQVTAIVKYIALAGILSHVVGEALPRRWFHHDRFPYRTCAWEREGKFYESLGIRRWKDRLPDKSKYTRHTFTKEMRGHESQDSLIRFLQETCVAELVHWVLTLVAVPLYFYVPTPLGWVVATVYALSNLPFICIQRYNRPRLRRILKRKLETA